MSRPTRSHAPESTTLDNQQRGEVLRRGAGPAAAALPWAPDLRARYATANGIRLRYVSAGSGPTVVLLHTLRTQLDMFQKVIPELASRFQVYALDYPGHGGSDAPNASYAADFFVACVADFLDVLDIQDAVLAGESIGGTIALLLAARHHPRVRGVLAVNPYDYDRGRGLRRSSPLANLVVGMNTLPLIGGAMAHVQPFPAVKQILEGGVYRKDAFPSALLRELHASGRKSGHPRAFTQLVRHWPSWEEARAEYGAIALPVLLLYGDHDWSRDDEREADRRAIPGSRMRVVKDAGHFLSIDAPSVFVRAVGEVSASARTTRQ